MYSVFKQSKESGGAKDKRRLGRPRKLPKTDEQYVKVMALRNSKSLLSNIPSAEHFRRISKTLFVLKNLTLMKGQI